MGVIRSFGMPHVNIQQRVGAIVIKHTQLEHVLRLCLKRLHALSIDSPEYDELMKVRKVSKQRQQIRDALSASNLDSDQQREVLQLLLDAADLSELRNSLAHDTWARKANESLMLVNDKTRKAVAVPSMAALKCCADDIDRVQSRLNVLTKALL
jgi:hypothetical protein